MKTIFASLVLSFGFFLSSCAAAPDNKTTPGGGTGGITYPAGVYVATNGNDVNSGLAKSSPVITIQVAINIAVSNNLSNVYIGEGYYTTNAGLSNISQPVTITNSGIAIYGGCDNTFAPQNGHYSVLDAQNALTNIMVVKDVSNVAINGLVVMRSSNRTISYRGETAFFITNAFSFVITNCLFISNNGYIGGAVAIYDCDSNVITAVFANNNAAYAGGLYFKSGKWNLFNSSFSNNIVRASGGGIGMEGISMSNTISGIFMNNSCGNVNGGAGGGIYITSTIATNTLIIDSLFVNNKAIDVGGTGGSGGAVYFLAPFGKIVHCCFSNNFASTSGAAINIVSSPNMLLSNCLISSNQVTNTSTSSGAGVYIVLADNCSIVDSMIINHLCTNNRMGGGLFVNQSIGFSLVNSTVSNNVAYIGGGGCYFTPTALSYIASNCLISYNRITNTGIAGAGGGIFSGGSNTTIFYCMIANNSTPDDDDVGGGIYINGSNTIVKWCVISNNYSRDGGGIYCVKYSEINGNQIVSNLAYNSGAGVYFTNGIYMLYNNISANCSVNWGYGAGVYAENAWGTLYINTIGSNMGAFYGNGIHVQNSSLTNTQNYFINDGNIISFAANNTAGGLVFNGNYISGTSSFNTGTAIYEITADTTNHTFINNFFITNRLGTCLYDNYNSTNDVKNDAAWTNINLTNYYYGATTAYNNQVTTW